MAEIHWNNLAKSYLKTVKEDATRVFAYERLVNSLSVLSLCDNSGLALDLGCGDGTFTNDLVSRYSKVYGVDSSRLMLNTARVRCPSAEFIECDLEGSLPLIDNKVDLIVSKNVLMYVNSLENIACESYRVLRPGGLLVISVTHPLKWVRQFERKVISASDYLGYLSETKIPWKIAGEENLKVDFINRPFQTYINTFTKVGFKLETVLEPGVPDAFVVRYPDFMGDQKFPYRLNMRFVKQ